MKFNAFSAPKPSNSMFGGGRQISPSTNHRDWTESANPDNITRIDSPLRLKTGYMTNINNPVRMLSKGLFLRRHFGA